MKNYAVILSSGTGRRFGGKTPKQFVKIAGRTLLEHCISVFESSPCIDEIVLVISPEYRARTTRILKTSGFTKVKYVVDGGNTRKESSRNGIMALPKAEANVFIHDCARALVPQRVIADCAKALKIHDAVETAIPATDTLVQVNDDNVVVNVPPRASMRQVQTPQCFRLSLIRKAHELAENDNDFTDDCGMVVKYSLAEIFVVDGDVENMKITYSQDLVVARNILNNR